MKKKSIIAVLSAMVLTIAASLVLVFTLKPNANADSEYIYTVPLKYLNYGNMIGNGVEAGAFTAAGKEWIKDKKYRVEIPNECVEINHYAFYKCEGLVSVSVPSTVIRIGDSAFLGCKNLTSVNMPEGVKYIGDWAFSGCSSLTSISIPSSVTSIFTRAFNNCKSLSSVNIAEGVTSIESYAFTGCSSLTSITMPESVTSIGGLAFDGCTNLTNIVVRNLELMDSPALADYKTQGYLHCFLTVDFDTGCDVVVASQSVEYETTINAPEAISRVGYQFKGWLLNGEPYDFNTPVTDNITLTATWEEKDPCTVTFDSNNGSAVDSQTVNYNAMVASPVNPTRDGYYKFNRWLLNGVPYDFNTPVTEDITLTADWFDPCVVTFNSDGGSLVDSQLLYHNGSVQEPNDPIYAGCTFMGWYLNDRLYNFNTPVTESITLQAKWGHTVTFDSDGGYEVDSQIVIDGENAYYRWTDKPYYNFIGWYIGDTEYDFGTPVTEDITLKAHWEIYQWEVIFDSNGGTAVAPQYIDHGSKVVEPTEPTRNGYFFCGWYRISWSGKGRGDSYDIVEYDFNTPVTEDITLTAVWKKIYNVKFINMDGEVYAIVPVVEGNVVEAPNVSLSGYTLKNWYNSDEAYDFTAPVMEDMTLTAEWELNPKSTEPEVQDPSNEETANEPETQETVVKDNKGSNFVITAVVTGVCSASTIVVLGAIVGMVLMKRRK